MVLVIRHAVPSEARRRLLAEANPDEIALDVDATHRTPAADLYGGYLGAPRESFDSSMKLPPLLPAEVVDRFETLTSLKMETVERCDDLEVACSGELTVQHHVVVDLDTTLPLYVEREADGVLLSRLLLVGHSQ